ncbi:MAG: hypothetical protein JO199_02970, partial [Candidatus Eremiobacteraeota bacterium]|nr:hypothetical protein [Candidatus Eremiobacteraeota bacterium]
GRLGSTDVRATSIAGAFDFGAAHPRPFERIPSKYSDAFFEHQKPSGLPPDDE